MTSANATDDRFIDVKERRFGWGTWVTLTALVLLTGLTAYMALTAAQWASHVGDLQATAAELHDDIAAEHEHIADLKEQYNAEREGLDATHPEISIVVDDKADAQDRQDLYANVSVALSSCAKERVTQIGYVREAYKYVPSSLASYEESIDKYCSKATKNLNEIIDSETEGEDE